MDDASSIWVLDCSKMTMSQKNNNDVTICGHDVIVNIFWRLCVSLVNFSFWSKFHVNIVTGSGDKTIFVYKGCDKKCGKFCPISEDWGYQFELNVCNKNFLNAAKFQVYRFYLFWVIELKTPGRVGVKILPLDQG